MERKGMRLELFAALLLTMVFFGSAPRLDADPGARPDGGFPSFENDIDYRISGDIYFGDQNRFGSPCVLCRDKIFKKIPAYQKILRENLDRHSARYYFLLEEANKVFRDKVKEVAGKLGFDLVVEKGGICADPDV